MKKRWILLYFLLAFLFIGCKTINNDENGNNLIEKTMSFNAEEMFVALDSKLDLPIDIIGYLEHELEFIVEDPTILELMFIRVKPLKIGATNVQVVDKENPEKSISIRVFVEREYIAVPRITTTIPIMKVGQTSSLIFTNLNSLGAITESFDIANSNDEVAIIEENLLVKALSTGVTTISATLRSNPNINGTFELQVVNEDVYRENGKKVLLPIPKNNSTLINAGEDCELLIDGVSDLSQFYWRSVNTQVARAGENGRIIGVAPGITEIYVYSLNDKDVYGRIFFEVEGTANVDYIERLIAAAKKELGYRQESDGYTKYGFWYGTYFGHHYTNLAWCAMFVSWCINEAGISTAIAPGFAKVTDGRLSYQEKGIYKLKEEYTPKAGDIIFFLREGAGHTGIVIGCDDEYVYTIEGNTSRMVAERKYKFDYRTIDGYGTPNYPIYNPSK